MDQGTDEKVLPMPRLLSLQNMRADKSARLRKRRGMAAMSLAQYGGGTIGTSDTFRRAIQHDDHKLLATDLKLYRHDGKDSDWVDTGSVPTMFSLQRREAIGRGKGTVGSINGDVAIANGVRVVVYEVENDTAAHADNSVWAIAYDESSGAVIVPDTKLHENVDGCGTPRAIVSGNTIIITWFDFANNDISGCRLITTSLGSGFSSEEAIKTDAAAGSAYDISSLSDAAFVLCYNDFTTGLFRVVQVQTSNFATLQTYNDTMAGTDMSIYVDKTASRVVAVRHSPSLDITARLLAFNLVLSSSVVIAASEAVFARLMVGPTHVANTYLVAYGVTSSTVPAMSRRYFNSYGTVGAETQTTSCIMCSRSFVEYGKTFIVLRVVPHVAGAGREQANQSFVVCEIDLGIGADEGETIAQPIVHVQVAMGQAWDGFGLVNSNGLAHIANVAAVSAGVWDIALGIRVTLSDFTQNKTGVDTIRIKRGNDRFLSARVGTNTFVGGGIVTEYDTHRLIESGFHHYPSFTLAQSNTASGALTLLGVYRYRVIYEYIDARGNAHRSASMEQTITLTGTNDTVTLSIAHLQLTRRHAGPRVIIKAIYRTAAGGSTFKRLLVEATYTALFPENFPNTTGWNNYIDVQPDTAVALGEPLYTTGGVLDHVPPPSSTVLIHHDGAIMGIDNEDKKRIWRTKFATPGNALGYNEGLQARSDDAGDFFALASQDGRVAAWKSGSIYELYGEGPSDTGAGTYPPMALVSVDVGCEEPRSVLSTPIGLVFRSQRGLEVLQRGGAVQGLGDQVIDILASYPVVSSVWHQRSENLIGWNVMNLEDSPTDGRRITYDYEHKIWNVDTGFSSLAAGLYDDLVVAVSATALRLESASSYADNSLFLAWEIVTGDIRLAALNGYQRTRAMVLLASWFANEIVEMLVSYDSGKTYDALDTVKWDVTGVTYPVTVAGDSVQLPRDLRIHRSDAIRFKLRSAQSAAVIDSAGVGLNVLSLKVAVDSGKLTALRRAWRK
jgi:hypothetical protein